MIGHGVDFDALSQISLRSLYAYLRAQGWREIDRFGNSVSVYGRDGDDEELLVPSSPLADYSRRVFDVLVGLSSSEDRDLRAVIRDISLSEFDLVRVRLPEADVQGSVPVAAGVSLFQESRNLLLAAACSAWRPQRAFRAGRVQEAGDYMSTVRLGQTEVGSFVVNLLSPVPPSLDGMVAADGGLSPEPFPRRVTRKLVSGLTSAEEAVALVNRGGAGIEEFESKVALGVSANLCDAIVGLLSHEGRQVLDVSVSWSLVRQPPGKREQIIFGYSDGVVLREASRVLKYRQERPNERLAGYVSGLARGQAERRGRVILKAIVDDTMSSIRVDFGPMDYSRIVEAHDQRRGVSLEGDLRRDGQRWVLDNPRDLSVDADDPDDEEYIAQHGVG